MVLSDIPVDELPNIALATGTYILSSLVQFSDEKGCYCLCFYVCSFLTSLLEKLGSAEVVEQVKLQDSYCVNIICKNPVSCTVLLYGPSYAMLDEIERVFSSFSCSFICLTVHSLSMMHNALLPEH